MKNIRLTKSQMALLCSGLMGIASVLMQACTPGGAEDIRGKLCGNWESAEGKPDVLVFKEGEHYKVTVFKRSGIRRRLKPETYLLQMEEDGRMYMNTGFRIDVAYNEATDVLTFSPNGDYLRAGTEGYENKSGVQ